ncbi:MAG: radical SAM protein [Anaerolineae bacterium]
MGITGMHRPLPLAQDVVYGPIRSRRLGVSLGINLLPRTHKVCSFDCIYCHYGRTDVKTMSSCASDFPTMHDVLSKLERALLDARERAIALDSLTFSGNGEPTLHPYFREIAFEVRRLRDRLCPAAKVSLFSNATTLTRPEIREALPQIDSPILKLDAGDPETFALVNRPDLRVNYGEVIATLKHVPNLVVQTVLVDGEVTNASDRAFRAWIERIAEIQPVSVQLYSTDYPVPDIGVQRVPAYRLRRLAEEATQRSGVPVRAYTVE